MVLYYIIKSNNTVFGEYYSITEAAASINCNEKTIIWSKYRKKEIKRRSWISLLLYGVYLNYSPTSLNSYGNF